VSFSWPWPVSTWCHVPYRGLAPAVTDLLGGQVHTIFSTMPPAISNIRAGKLRALAVTSTTRSEALPDCQRSVMSCPATKRPC
jgi:tripartite-type tricarboxylate transporter receptor subunit TctC